MAYGLYIHIPYCRSRCHYCDFYSQAGWDAVPQAYVDALLCAFEQQAPKDATGEPKRPQTVYFGGGTPSLLSPGQVAEILRRVRPKPDAEITLEANPGSELTARLEGYRKAGVNRLSLGVQSARDETLQRLGRPHTAAEAKQAIRLARRVGFTNISGDVMLALPYYTRAEFDETLSLLQENGAQHISAYLLKREPNTRFGRQPPPGLPDEDDAAEMYLYAAGQLEKAGYARYEISNFAKPGKEGRHNLIYWDCKDYLGLGPAAHSCLAGNRWFFPADVAAFLRGDLGPQPQGTATAEDYIMLRLRLDKGLDEQKLEDRFGRGLTEGQREKMQRFVREGFAKKTKEGWALTSRGMLVQNSLLVVLLA